MASSVSDPFVIMSYATWMAGRPSEPLLRNPFADEITTGRPAKELPGVADRSRMKIAGIALASFGRASPAAAAAPAPMKSRRFGDTNDS